MQKRILIIIAGVIILLLIGVGAWYFLARTPAQPGAPLGENPFGMLGTTSTPQGSETITARDGSPVQVTAFTKGVGSVPLSENDPEDVQYELTPYGDYVPGQPYPTHEFDVQYNRKTSEFIVTLNQEPLGHARIAAETFLRNRLQVSDSELCALNVTISVPYAVNATYAAYQNLGPSACSGSIRLP